MSTMVDYNPKNPTPTPGTEVEVTLQVTNNGAPVTSGSVSISSIGGDEQITVGSSMIDNGLAKVRFRVANLDAFMKSSLASPAYSDTRSVSGRGRDIVALYQYCKRAYGLSEDDTKTFRRRIAFYSYGKHPDALRQKGRRPAGAARAD